MDWNFSPQPPYPPGPGQGQAPGQMGPPGQAPYPGQMGPPGQAPYPGQMGPPGQPPYPGQMSPPMPGPYPDQQPGGIATVSGVPNSVPSVSDMQQLPGYEGIGFESMPSAPPPISEDFGPAPERGEIANVPRITEEDAREALINYVSEHCCFGSKAAKEMVLKDINYRSAFHYTLETFCEKRETAWVFESYDGTPFQTGYAPGVWDIILQPSCTFENSKAILEVPNTSSVKPCHDCMALGHKRCTSCHGRGNTNCTWCHGDGMRREAGNDYRTQCSSCHGSGHSRCFHCHGNGHVTCSICKGRAQLRYFVRLTTTWTDHKEDHISDCAALPRELIRDVSGQVAFEEKSPRVWPVGHFPDPTVNQASYQLVSKHKSAFPLERQLEQRHQVRIIPIAEVDYTWKDKSGQFQVYGFENKIYFPDYPQTCCCGCSIL